MIESHNNRKRDKKYFKNYDNLQISIILFYLACTGIDILQYNETKYTDLSEKLKKKNHHRNLLIPKVISALFPKINFEEYTLMMKDDVFNRKIAFICENCYLDITKYCYFTLNKENLLRTIRPHQGNIAHTSVRKPLTASNFNNVNFIKTNNNFGFNNNINIHSNFVKEKNKISLNMIENVKHKKSKSENKFINHINPFNNIVIPSVEKVLPDIKLNYKIMNKIIKRNNHLNKSHGTEMTDISEILPKTVDNTKYKLDKFYS